MIFENKKKCLNKNNGVKFRKERYLLILLFFCLVPSIGCLNSNKIKAEELNGSKNNNSSNNGQNNTQNNNQNNTQNFNAQNNEKNLNKIGKGKDFIVKVNYNGKLTEMFMSEYILGVAAAEIGLNKPKEAIKAQIVASLSYALFRKGINNVFEANNSFQCYMPREERIKKYGEKIELELEKLVKNVGDLKVLIYTDENGNEHIVECVYDTCLPDRSRTNDEVWGGEKIIYFSSVVSPEVMFVRNCNKMTPEKIKSELGEMGFAIYQLCKKNVETKHEIPIKKVFDVLNSAKDAKGKKRFNPVMPQSINNSVIKVVSRFKKSGFVKDVEVLGVKVSGEFLRRSLGLSSSHFKVKIENGKIVFVCLGKGHGVGMSQYGACIYALFGYNFIKILKHYYPCKNIKFVALKDVNPKLLVK